MRDPQILVQSLVEGDPARVVRFRRLRRKAVLLSVAVEAMLLAALLLAPLATPGTLRGRLDWTPMPPYGGAPHVSAPPASTHGDSTPRHHLLRLYIFQPPSIPPRVDRSGDKGRESTDATPGQGVGDDPRDGLIQVPFDSDPKMRIPGPTPPPPIQQRPRTVRLSEGVQSALLSYRIVPAYPIIARQTHTEGEVKLHAIIATDGTIRSLEVESGHPLD